MWGRERNARAGMTPRGGGVCGGFGGFDCDVGSLSDGRGGGSAVGMRVCE